MLTILLIAPLIGFLINGMVSLQENASSLGLRHSWRNHSDLIGIIGCGSVLISFAISMYTFILFLQGPESWRVINTTLFSWIPDLGVHFSLKLDALSQVMVLIVTGVGFFIHLYSIDYMKDDAGIARYFSFLNLFTFSMLLLVLANNLLLLFIGWEGVGLCSYLLIGFWFEDEKKAAAGKKAFIVNRIGDLAFLLALFLTYVSFGTLTIESLSLYEIQPHQITTLTLITFLLFIGACGKSAQIPLYVWLPDAMAGPTPVSALIHAATMVTAGVYMIARLHFFYLLTPFTMTIVATIGLLTALLAASIAFFQNDIKKVLAYSTISQLGYMFLAAGIGAFSSAIFHLITHAFFKALLFLAAGSVIQALHHEQDIQKMGGVKSKLPLTHLAFLCGTLAIIGIPPFSGFFSKDEILWIAFNKSPWVWFLGWLGAMMTCFYMVRLYTIVFHTSSSSLRVFPNSHSEEHLPNGHSEEHRRCDEESPPLHEAPLFMTIALIVLSLFSFGGGLIGFPHLFQGFLPSHHFLENFLNPVFKNELQPLASTHTEFWLMGFTIVSTLIVSLSTFTLFTKNREWATHIKIKFSKIHRIISNKYYVDEGYDRILVGPLHQIAHFSLKWLDIIFIDGFVNGLSKLSLYMGGRYTEIQNGNLQTYAFIFVIGVVGIFLYYWNFF